MDKDTRFTNYTPGPWEVNGPGGREPVRLRGREVWARDFTGAFKAIVERVRGGSPEQAQANARLIAAAPELLEACAALREENARLEQRARNLEGAHVLGTALIKSLTRERDEARAEVKRLREENARLRRDGDDQFLRQQQVIGEVCREREEARAEVKRLEGLILDFDYWHSHQATAKEAPDELIVEARRIRAARSGSEGSE